MSIKFIDYKLLCNKGSATFNEDVVGLSPYGAWVIDGATGLNGKNLISNESDAKWYVNWWNKYLHENLYKEEGLKEIVVLAFFVGILSLELFEKLSNIDGIFKFYQTYQQIKQGKTVEGLNDKPNLSESVEKRKQEEAKNDKGKDKGK